MSRLALYLLGVPRLEREGQGISVSRQKALALLAYLAVTGHDHGRDTLATLLWPEYDQSRARANLRGVLTSLRHTLGEGWLQADRETVGLNVGSWTRSRAPESAGAPEAAYADVGRHSGDVAVREFWLDVTEFQVRLAGCRTHDHPPDHVCPACLSPLAEAAALYHDDFMAGFTLRDSSAFDDWQFFQTEGLRRELADVLQRLVLGLGLQGEFERAIPYARRWAALDPLHEPAHRHLMQLYAWSGQRAAALRQYAECERVLDQELGVPPEEETTQLYEAIQARQEWTPSPEMPLEGGVPISTQAHARQQQQPHDLYAPNNLPVQLTPFVGRETELAELDRLLSDPNVRLVTVLGVGGMGKTRLALEAAARQLDQYPHGVYWVSLASLRSVEAIESTVAGALGFTFYSAADSGAATTPRRQLLDYLRYKSLLLLLDSCEPLLEGVDLVSEILQTAPGLRILATSRASLNVQEEYLFHIAGLEYPEPVTQATVETPVDAAIPEGRPEYSAIKLFMQSARRVRPDFAPRADDLEYIARICHLVQGMPLGILLAAAWVEMLSPQEIARELADGEGQGLDFLATDLRNVPERQRSIRTVFDHSWNLLPGRQQAVMEALSVFHGGCTREAAQVVTGASLRDLKSLVDRSLLQRTAAGRYELHQLLRQYAAGRLAGRPAEDEAAHDRHAAYYAQLLHGRAEGRTRIRGSEAMPEIDNARAGWQWAAHKARATWMRDLVYGLVRGYQALGWWREGIAFLQEAIRTLRAVEPGQDRDMALATALAGHAYLLWMIGESEQVPGLFRESQALLRQLDAQEELALCNLWAAWTTVYPDDVRGQLLEESLAIATRIGQPSLASQALRIQAYRAMRDGAYDRAQWCGETALRTSRDAGLRSEMRASWVLLGNVAHLTSDYVKAGQCYQEALALAEKLKNRYSMVALRVDLGDVALAVGEYEQAREHYKDALARYVEASDHRTHARILCGLGDVALAMKDLSSASDQYRRALRLAAEKTDETSCAGAMIGPSALLVQRGEFELAAEVLALVLETNPYPVQARSAAYRLLDALQSELSPALFVTTQERGRARDVRATVEELLGEL